MSFGLNTSLNSVTIDGYFLFPKEKFTFILLFGKFTIK